MHFVSKNANTYNIETRVYANNTAVSFYNISHICIVDIFFLFFFFSFSPHIEVKYRFLLFIFSKIIEWCAFFFVKLFGGDLKSNTYNLFCIVKQFCVCYAKI